MMKKMRTVQTYDGHVEHRLLTDTEFILYKLERLEQLAGVENKDEVPAMDSLIEIVDWRISNNDYLWLDVRVTRDDGIRLVHMRIVKGEPNCSDSLNIVDQRKES